MKSEKLFESYSKHKAWSKSMSNFKSSLGLNASDLNGDSFEFDDFITSMTSMSAMKALSMLPAHKTASMHLRLALIENGIDPEFLTKKKISLLSFILSSIGFKRFDEVIDLVVHDGQFLDIKAAMEADDKHFTNLIFSVLKTIFPPLSALESIIKGALQRI